MKSAAMAWDEHSLAGIDRLRVGGGFAANLEWIIRTLCRRWGKRCGRDRLPPAHCNFQKPTRQKADADYRGHAQAHGQDWAEVALLRLDGRVRRTKVHRPDHAQIVGRAEGRV